MYCNNCGAENEGAAKFCANCGTTLGTDQGPLVPPAQETPSVQYQQPSAYQAPNYQAPGYQPPNYPQPGYQPQGPLGGGNSPLKNIGIGCLIAIAIVFFVGLSCTRACFGLHRASRILRYR